MKLTLLDENSIRLEPTEGPMNIEALSAEQSYSPFHMLAGGLAYCIFSVLHSWASHASLNADELTIDVQWTFAEDPHRVGSMTVRFDWPGLPPNRLEAARRVSEMCTIHATLHHPPTITIEGSAGKK
jgi:putative redox protein